MQQIALTFDPPRARRTDAQTSHDAADRAREFVASHELRIFHFLNAISVNRPPLYNGATYRDIAHAMGMGMEPVAVARRLRGMELKGVIVRDGVRDGMTVWRAA